MAKDKEDVLRQVQALLDRAASSGFDAEADACRKKADDLMLAYSIEHWEIQQRKNPNEREVPTLKEFHISGPKNPLSDDLVSLFSALCRFVGAKPVYYGLRYKGTNITARVVGFPTDLAYLEMLYTSLHTQMQSNLRPKPDPDATFEENLVLLKEAGVKWTDLHAILQPDVPWERKIGVRYTAIYTNYCKKHNRERMYTSPLTYQLNFAEGFVTNVSIRLMDIKAAQREESSVTGSGMELMLIDKNAAVNALFDDEFSNLRSIKGRQRGKFDYSAYNRGSEAGKNADLGQSRVGRGPKEIG
jgi:hypothetical protein